MEEVADAGGRRARLEREEGQKNRNLVVFDEGVVNTQLPGGDTMDHQFNTRRRL